jgi:hypothetical protein
MCICYGEQEVPKNQPLQWTGPASSILINYDSVGAVPAIYEQAVVKFERSRSSGLNPNHLSGVTCSLMPSKAPLFCLRRGRPHSLKRRRTHNNPRGASRPKARGPAP